MSADPPSLPWRTGRKVGRTIYAQPDGEASDDDPLIGLMDTPELAAEAAAAHNFALTYRQALRSADAAAVLDDDLDDEFHPETGRLTASDRELVARVTGGGIRNKELFVPFEDEP
jgi:hypothetical protein